MLSGVFMTTNTSFNADRKFWDDQNFPYGFARSGDFTIKQAELLERHGQAYLMLAQGHRELADLIEKRFVAFCRGEKEADNVHEKIWKRYSDKLHNQGARYLLARAEGQTEGSDTSLSVNLDD